MSIGSRCGAAGLRAIAANWRLSKAAPYSDDLGYRFRMLARDSALFGAATQLAQDASASVAVRVLSLRGLMSVIDIGVQDAAYDDLTGTPPGRGCIPSPVPVTAPYAGSTLPSTYVTQITTIATSLEGNANEAAEIRSAANCVMNTWRRVAGYPAVALGSLNRSAITLAYVCGSKWSVRNANDLGVTVTWSAFVPGVGERSGPLFLPPRPSGQPYSAQTIESPNQVNGGISLSLDGTLLMSVVPVSRTSCP